jgi:opacity protein-like surface antigen
MGKLTRDYKNDYTDFYEGESWYFWNVKEDYKYTSTVKEVSKQNKVGFKGGLGLEMNMTPSISLRFHFDL